MNYQNQIIQYLYDYDEALEVIEGIVNFEILLHVDDEHETLLRDVIDEVDDEEDILVVHEHEYLDKEILDEQHLTILALLLDEDNELDEFEVLLLKEYDEADEYDFVLI